MEKQVEISAGGYDYQFVETPLDMLICKICHFPSREPCLSECCGHTFCKSCIDHAKKVTVLYSCPCPVCRSEEFKLIRNKQNERVIKSLRVYCINKVKGCGWQGEINDVNDHLENKNGCSFEEVTCPNRCDQFLQRNCLSSHLESVCPRRKVNCQYCHITDELQCIEGNHVEKCPKFPLSCPNDCGISDIPREDVNNHREVCPLEEVDCPSKCGVLSQRKYLQNHIENECPCREVNCQYCQTMGEQQFIEGQHVELCPKFPLVCPNKCEAKNILREDMDTHKNNQCPLEMVQCEYHSLGCKTTLARRDLQKHNQEKMEVHLCLTRNKLETTEQLLLSTKQQLATSIEEAVSSQAKLLEKVNAIGHLSQLSIANLELKLQQATEHMEWTLHINNRANCFKNQILPVIIKMPEFKRKKMNEEDWYSHYFFTGENGYKMKLNVIAAGWDVNKGTHLSVYLYLMKGTDDDELNWPMKKRFEVKLLNQIKDGDHHSYAAKICAHRNKTKGNTSFWNCGDFINHFALNEFTAGRQKFLDNDSLFFEVSEL